MSEHEDNINISEGDKTSPLADMAKGFEEIEKEYEGEPKKASQVDQLQAKYENEPDSLNSMELLMLGFKEDEDGRK